MAVTVSSANGYPKRYDFLRLLPTPGAFFLPFFASFDALSCSFNLGVREPPAIKARQTALLWGLGEPLTPAGGGG